MVWSFLQAQNEEIWNQTMVWPARSSGWVDLISQTICCYFAKVTHVEGAIQTIAFNQQMFTDA